MQHMYNNATAKKDRRAGNRSGCQFPARPFNSEASTSDPTKGARFASDTRASTAKITVFSNIARTSSVYRPQQRPLLCSDPNGSVKSRRGLRGGNGHKLHGYFYVRARKRCAKARNGGTVSANDSPEVSGSRRSTARVRPASGSFQTMPCGPCLRRTFESLFRGLPGFERRDRRWIGL